MWWCALPSSGGVLSGRLRPKCFYCLSWSRCMDSWQGVLSCLGGLKADFPSWMVCSQKSSCCSALKFGGNCSNFGIQIWHMSSLQIIGTPIALRVSRLCMPRGRPLRTGSWWIPRRSNSGLPSTRGSMTFGLSKLPP